MLQPHPPDGVEVPGRALRDLERQPRLARATRPRHGHQAGAGEEVEQDRHLVIAADQFGGRRGQVGANALQGARRREVRCRVPVDHEVEQLAGSGEVLDAVLAQGLELVAVAERACGLTGQDLPTVGRGADPSGVVHVGSPVVAIGDAGLAGVDPHTHARLGPGRPGVLGQRPLRGDCGVESGPGLGEGDEERVALGADLHPAMARPDRAQQPVVLGEERAVVVAQRVEQTGGALDVGEQHRHRARGERPGHGRPAALESLQGRVEGRAGAHRRRRLLRIRVVVATQLHRRALHLGQL